MSVCIDCSCSFFSRMASSPYSQSWSGAAAVLFTGSTVKEGGHTDRPTAESGLGTAFVAMQMQDLQSWLLYFPRNSRFSDFK